MGDNFDEGDADELPVHEVYLGQYYISKYEISNEQYGYFCQETGRAFNPALGNGYPVHNVSWHDAKAFCNWLSQKTGEKIDLPTEAQWEKAARGTDQRRYPWDTDFVGCYYAAYFGCGSSGDQPGDLATVYGVPGFEGRSFYNVYHMAGNVSEWCRDRYSSSYYSNSPVDNPQGPAAGSYRVIRGGSIASSVFEIRSANRDFKNPDYAGKEQGFRIVRE
jgi:formylglycine-generating enzyme required for sulfatase activity